MSYIMLSIAASMERGYYSPSVYQYHYIRELLRSHSSEYPDAIHYAMVPIVKGTAKSPREVLLMPSTWIHPKNILSCHDTVVLPSWLKDKTLMHNVRERYPDPLVEGTKLIFGDPEYRTNLMYSKSGKYRLGEGVTMLVHQKALQLVNGELHAARVYVEDIRFDGTTMYGLINGKAKILRALGDNPENLNIGLVPTNLKRDGTLLWIASK